ncbi:MAG: peptidase domain protein [Bryobacterales bacterium]|nr:peptidase domain protein [Bryobacterales bacterium]
MRPNRILQLALPLFLATLATSQTLPTGVQKKATLAGITEYTYSNGLRVVLIPDASSPKITVNMVYMVGSRHEGYGETGMAHLLEHMNFISTTNGRSIKNELTAHGAQWNGTTDYDRTNYYETFNATDDNLKWALSLEADRMVNIRQEKQILDTEMTVVRNEFERGENSPQRVLMERVLSTAYLWHNYGKSVIGSRVDLERVPIDRLAAFYRKFYQPDNAVLVIAGKIDATQTLAYVAQTVGAIPKPTRKLEDMYTVEPPQDGERYVELRRVGNGRQVIMAWHGPAMAHADSAALEILTGILNGANGTGRLTKALLDNKKAISARINFNEMHDPGYIMASASLSDDQSLDDVRATLSSTVAGMATEPPTKDEVERVKTRIIRQMELSMNNSERTGMGLTETIANGDWRLLFLNYEQIKAVTPEDVARVAKLYFKVSNRTVGVFLPTPDPDRTFVPETPDLEKSLSGLKTTMPVSEIGAFDPTPANIEKHLTRTTLPNGLKLVTLARPAKGNQMSVTIQLRFGDEKSLASKSAVAQMTGSLLMRGTKNKTRQQIQDEMDKLNARVAVGGGGGGRGGGGAGVGLASVSASVQTVAANLGPALHLAVEMLREPAFPESDFDQVKKQMIDGLERGRAEPGMLAVEALQRGIGQYPKGDVRYVRNIDEQVEELKKVTLDDVRAFHKQFYGASNAIVVVSGELPPTEVQKLVEPLLGNWKSSLAYARIESRFQRSVAPINLKIETPDKQNAQFEAGMNFLMTDADPDYPAMLLANYIFGGSITARLPDRIRNREGLSYSVNSGMTAPSEGNLASFRALAIANPKNAPKVEASFKDELAKTLEAGFTAEEVSSAKRAYLDQRAVQRAQEQALPGLILQREASGRTLAWDEQMDNKLAALTPAQVSAAFRKYVDPTKVSIVKAGDFKAAEVYR